MQHKIVYKDSGAYTCFPAIAQTKDGKLLVTFRRAGGFSLEAVKQGKYDHVDKGARIGLAVSEDAGESWNAEIFPQYDPECGEQDPSIGVFSDGMQMINFFRWRVVPEAQKDRLGHPARQQYDGSWSDVEGPYVIRSFDQGKTWEDEAILVSSEPYLRRGGTSDAVIELPDGTLMMGLYGADYDSNVCRAYTVKSIDHGKTWSKPVLLAEDPNKKISFEEPALIVLDDGSLLAMIRAGEAYKYQYLYQAVSHDNGESWTDLHETPMWGHPAHVLKLNDGRLVCTYGYRREPFGVRACVSTDNGKSWDIENEIILRDDGVSRDVGYPCSIQRADGKIVTVYYIHGEDLIRHIAATIWELN